MRFLSFRWMLLSVLTFKMAVLQAQILEVDPVFPTVDDVVTIVYNATEGNGTLVGTTPVYAHTGVITSESTTPNDWKFVQGEWGEVDATVLMTDLGNDRHSITIDMDQFYGFPVGTEVLKMGFVFRNADGSLVGRASDGSDIFYDVYSDNGEVQASILVPAENLIVELNDMIDLAGSASADADLTFYDNGAEIATTMDATSLEHTLTVSTSGTHTIVFKADNGSSVSTDTIYYTVREATVVEDPPAGMKNGINYLSSTSVLLQLYAPEKEYVHLIGDFTNWQARSDYQMKQSIDGNRWWIQLDGLTPNKRYGYQYWVDGEIKIADPMSPLILDPYNDGDITLETFAGLHPYPYTKTSGFVTVMHPGASEYQWESTDFQRPQQNHLVIYELLVRDFLEEHNYATLIDTLDYLENMGINAIELMPPGEFEGNDSWGYNPSFHMALDKYYGSPNKFKEFVDECHSRGIAVIVDMVLNHAFGQNPMVNLYWDGPNNTTAANSPWFNAVCPHEPYCWGFDFNHSKPATQEYVDQVNSYWLEEYNIDGFRFDFTSGFHNGPSGGYSAVRISNVKRMADAVWATEPGAYVILEHWCDNDEEKNLADYQCMLWGNVTTNYQEAAMGYLGGSNFNWGLASQRGWSWQHLVSYMESHDEERVTYKSLQYGNNDGGDYDIKNIETALARNELTAVFFLSQPGPKMIWQFQELGYDQSINLCDDGTLDEDCRVEKKPILWEYYLEDNRRRLYDIYKAMGWLRSNYPNTMNSSNISHSFGGAFKRLNLYGPDMDVVVIGNFDVVDAWGLPNFPYTGTWYDYFAGEPIIEENLSNEFLMRPGEYRIYTSIELPKPDVTIADTGSTSTGVLDILDIEAKLYPNPVSNSFRMEYDLEEGGDVRIFLYSEAGKRVRNLYSGEQSNGRQQLVFDITNVAAGNYWVLIDVDGAANAFPIVKVE